ncbi:hypothetical protein [Bradyrhizobium sp. BTAi1]|uniref:hypothetical protein n=1 Tax=Bradyrhizobium sp. (strain BTAi1 / ATCC BAA-1182) TaxID=288000 RepID=UPI0011D06313|nr:hypothetical protein [Bradyrhizobium sp. BTAi1]
MDDAILCGVGRSLGCQHAAKMIAPVPDVNRDQSNSFDVSMSYIVIDTALVGPEAAPIAAARILSRS